MQIHVVCNMLYVTCSVLPRMVFQSNAGTEFGGGPATLWAFPIGHLFILYSY